MRPTIRLINLLKLLLIGIGMAIILSNLLIQITHYLFSTSFLNKSTILQNFLIHIAICSSSLLYLYLYEKKGIKTIQRLIPLHCNFQRLSGLIIPAQLMMTLALILYTSIKETLGYANLQPALHFNSIAHFLFYGVLQTALLAPFGEELLFRCILQKILYEITYSKWLASIINALTFSLIHCNNTNILLYFTMGCFFNLLYQKTKYIIYPIIAHALHNLIVITIVYSEVNETIQSTVNRLPIVVRSILTIGCLLIAYFCVTYSVIDKKKQPLP